MFKERCLTCNYHESSINRPSIPATTLVPVVVEEGDVVEVALVVSTCPNNFRGVGEGQRDTVDAEEDEVGVYEIFHEAEAHLILFNRG